MHEENAAILFASLMQSAPKRGYLCMELSAKSASGVNLLYTESAWTGKRTLTVDGKPAIKLGKKKFATEDENGNRTEYDIVGSYLTGITVKSSTGEKTVLAKNAWYDWVFAALSLIGIPFGVIFCGAIGGGLSALFCLLGAFFIIGIARSGLPKGVKIVVQLVIAVIANCLWFGLWYIIAVMILSAVGTL